MGLLLFSVFTLSYGQVQITENFDTGNSIPTSSGSAPSVPTDYSTSSGTWTLFKAYRHGTTNFSAPYAIRLLKNTAAEPAYMVTPVLNTAGVISFHAYGSSSKAIYVYKSTNGGTSWTFLDSVFTGTGAFAACSVTVNDGSANIRLKIENGTGAGNDLNVDNVQVTSYSEAPNVTITPETLPSFGAVLAGSSSASLSFQVSGVNLNNPVKIFSVPGFKVSHNDTLFTDSLTFNHTGGVLVSSSVYIRFMPASAVGTLSGDITVSSVNAVTRNLTVSGIAVTNEPTNHSTLTFGAITGSSMELNFTGGNGAKRVVVLKKASAVSWVPGDGSVVAGANANFAIASDQGGGNKAVYNGTGTTVTVTGLEGNTTYHAAVYEYNEATGNSQNYFTANAPAGSNTTQPVPLITALPQSLAFGNVLINTSSVEKTVTVNASTLSPASGSLTATAPAGYQVSLASGSGFAGSVAIPYSGGAVSNITLYIKFNPTAVQPYNDTLRISGGTAPNALVSVTGNGVPPSQPNVFEAEDGLFDGTYIRTQHTGYSGWGYADINDKSGASLEFVFKKETATTETVTIRFANGASSRSYQVLLNDNLLGTLNFPSTGGWTTWSTVTYQVAFSAGVSRLKFASTSNSANANIDRIELSGETATPMYKLVVTKSGAGTVSSSHTGEFFEKGTAITLTAQPAAGNMFYRWNGSVVSYVNPTIITMDAHKTQIALMNDTTGYSTFPYYDKPKGFAALPGYGYNSGTTGGHGPDGNVIYVRTADELQTAMLRRLDANGTLNFAPLTVYVVGILSRDAGIGEMVDVKDTYDISIIGVGSDATITGFGLNIYRSKNIIVRNIKFASWGDDGISVDAGDDGAKGNHIWIDHCTFTYVPPPGYPAGSTPDGSLDVTHSADYVTISYCLFDSTDKNSLVGHSNSNVSDTVMKLTYHHNWFKNSNQRNPRVRFAKVHVYNNYYTNNSIYGVSSNMEADVMVEGNYFFNTPIPTEPSRDGGPPGDIVERNNVFVQCGTALTRGLAFEPSDYYQYSLDLAANMPQVVPQFAGSGLFDFSNPENSVVPVELVSFNAEQAGTDVVLEWKTASETNNQGWDVESKSSNGSWEKIGFVTGTGSSTALNRYTYTDNRTKSPGVYYYRLRQMDFDGSFSYSQNVSVTIYTAGTFVLGDNYPNPFNPSTTISFELPERQNVHLAVYDVLGNQIKILVNDKLEAGSHKITADMASLPSGVYIYRLISGAYTASRRMVLLK